VGWALIMMERYREAPLAIHELARKKAALD
jgi:hypothetical protein